MRPPYVRPYGPYANVTVRNAYRPASVYRCYDAYGELLYIGCAVDVAARMRTHKVMSQWHADVFSTTTEPHDTRIEALAAERAAIESEHPKFNVLHSDINQRANARGSV